MKERDGSGFLATSFHRNWRGLDQILKNAGAGFFITSSTFRSSSRKLKDKLKVLSKAGMSGARFCSVVYFSLSDEEEMWRTGCLEDDRLIALLSTVVKHNSQHLNMQTWQEVTVSGDNELLKDSQNRPCFVRTDSMKQENTVKANKQSVSGTDLLQALKRHKPCQYCILHKSTYTHQPQGRRGQVSLLCDRPEGGQWRGSCLAQRVEDETSLSQGCCPQAGKESEGGALWKFYFHLPNSGFQAVCPSAPTITSLLIPESLPVLHPIALVWCKEGERLSNKSTRWKSRTLNPSWGGLHMV